MLSFFNGTKIPGPLDRDGCFSAFNFTDNTSPCFFKSSHIQTSGTLESALLTRKISLRNSIFSILYSKNNKISQTPNSFVNMDTHPCKRWLIDSFSPVHFQEIQKADMSLRKHRRVILKSYFNAESNINFLHTLHFLYEGTHGANVFVRQIIKHYCHPLSHLTKSLNKYSLNGQTSHRSFLSQIEKV